jgi:hypothetical protein
VCEKESYTSNICTNKGVKNFIKEGYVFKKAKGTLSINHTDPPFIKSGEGLFIISF